jgi:hypothetical protein
MYFLFNISINLTIHLRNKVIKRNKHLSSYIDWTLPRGHILSGTYHNPSSSGCLLSKGMGWGKTTGKKANFFTSWLRSSSQEAGALTRISSLALGRGNWSPRQRAHTVGGQKTTWSSPLQTDSQGVTWMWFPPVAKEYPLAYVIIASWAPVWVGFGYTIV